MSEHATSVTVEPSRKTVKVSPGTHLLDLIMKLNLRFLPTCGGKGKCGKCKVKIEKGLEGLQPPSESDLKHLLPQEIDEGYRLACATLVPPVDQFTFRVMPINRALQPKLQTEGAPVLVSPDPLVRKYVVELAEPDPSYEEVVVGLLRDEHGIDCRLDFDALKMLPASAAKGKGRVTCVVYDGGQIMAVEPGDTSATCLGFAADIGTTKLAGYLIDLNTGRELASSAQPNPQVVFGDDVMSRIAFAMGGKSKQVALQKTLLEGINLLLHECCASARLSYRFIYESCFVGNTCMMHLLLGLSPQSLAFFPYQSTFRSGLTLKGRELSTRLTLHPAARVYVLPVIAGFVGADTVAVQLAVGPAISQGVRLVLDIGTNTEVVLSDRNGSIACSCASGPAFEGMHITHGRKADSASIEKISINDETFDVDFKTIDGAKPAGLCGSGIISAIAEFLRVGIIASNGKLNSGVARKTSRMRNGTVGGLEFVIAWKDETGIDSDIVVTQKDISEVQKAKAAIYTGCLLLMKQKGITADQIDELILAGAFGQYLDKASARDIGLLPEVQLDRIRDVGNAAGTGAKLSLISSPKRKEAEDIARSTGYYELALDPDFVRVYASSMLFPQYISELKAASEDGG